MLKSKSFIFSVRAFVLVLLILTVIFTSCSDPPDKKNISSDDITEHSEFDEPTTDKQPLPVSKSKCEISDDAISKFENIDFGNGNAVFAVKSGSAVLPDDTEAIINREKYSRINMLEEKLNFTAVRLSLNDNELYSQIRAAENSGLYFADFVCVSPNQLWRYSLNGYAKNLKTLPFIDFNAPYYDSGSTEQASPSNELFGAVGSLNSDPTSLAAILFNKAQANELDKTSLYSYVYDGGWTLEKFNELSKLYTANSGMNGVVTSYTDEQISEKLFFASEGNYVSKESGRAEYTPFDEIAQSTVDAISGLLYGQKYSFMTNEHRASELFEAEKSLFFITKLSTIDDYADIGIDWGILPLPTLAGSESKTLPGDGATVSIILSKTPDLTRSGILLEAANAAMYGYADNDIYLENAMNRILQDNSSVNMLDKIISSVSYDFAYMYSGGVNGLANATYRAVSGAVSSKHDLTYYNRLSEGIGDRVAALSE